MGISPAGARGTETLVLSVMTPGKRTVRIVAPTIIPVPTQVQASPP